MSAHEQTAGRDIWSAEDYDQKVAPYVATLTEKIVAWLNPSPNGKIHYCRPEFVTDLSFDKVFSNAALHWILRDENTRVSFMKACFDALKPGGKFVSESGALGNVAEVHAALIGELVHRGVPQQKALELSPWWFPSIEAMRSLVESAGFQWIRGEIELRQTKLTENEDGAIAGW